MAANLTADQLRAIGVNPSLIDGSYYQTVGGQMINPNQGEGTTPIEGYVSYDPAKTAIGDSFANYDPTGVYSGQGKFQDPTPISDFLIPFGAALGMGALLPGMGAGAAESAGVTGLADGPSLDAFYGGDALGTDAAGTAAGTGTAGDVLSKAALDGTNAFGANSVPGAFDLATAPGAGVSFANPFSGMKLSDLKTAAQVASAVNSIINGTGGAKLTAGGGPSGPTTPFDYGSPEYTIPGWRTDRPMYVPGRDAIPDGWLGAGGMTQG